MREMALRLARIEDEGELRRLLGEMAEIDMVRFDACFEAWHHKAQMPPREEGWRTWLMMAGRGFGKTRAGAEWITGLATQAGRPVRIALVAATEADARAVMVEGESGLLSVGRYHRKAPLWEPSRGRLVWPGGSEAQVFSGADPDGLRGPAHHFAWCDELAKWERPEESWDNLQMTLRCGPRPRALVTTTPRPIAILKRIEAERWTVRSGGATGDNPHLPEAFLEAMVATYGGTRLGRQELDGALIADVEGALWSRELIEGSRLSGTLPRNLRRVVIGVDPPASAGGDACGIVACGVDRGGTGYVLADHSVGGLSPEGWARAVAGAAELHCADRVIAEANQGGAMVESVLRAADCGLPVKLVHASRGKSARAEPVAALFEAGRARFAGIFTALEDELAGMTIGGGYEGPGRSPDRADAMVWAMTELMLGKTKAGARITFF
jgi:phage terminase large subunit-like protein